MVKAFLLPADWNFDPATQEPTCSNYKSKELIASLLDHIWDALSHITRFAKECQVDKVMCAQLKLNQTQA
eukprot:515644-Pelagomonas_calceolata.AAC.1